MRSRLWEALEQVPGLAAVSADWQRLLGLDYEAFCAFLRPTQKLAQSYPCTQSTDCGCRHAVVRHGPDDIVAACRCDPVRCDVIPLRRNDIVLYEVNLPSLAKAAAGTLGVSCVVAPLAALPATWNIGSYNPTASFRFPVYLTIQFQKEDFRESVAHLTATSTTPFILLAPTRRFCRPTVEEMLRSKGAMFLTLEELLGTDTQGLVVPLRVAEDVLREFRAHVMPLEKAAPAIAFFPTPPGASWGNVEIRFVDGETASVCVGDVRHIFHYAEMGMVDGRNKRPTKQWKLLHDFAQRNGVLDWRSPSACRKNQKRREMLARDLQAFFRIEGDPIRLTEDGKGWRVLFSVVPE